MFGMKHKGKILPFTFAETSEQVEIKFKDAVSKAAERLGEKVNETPEAFDNRHDHICDLSKGKIERSNNR